MKDAKSRERPDTAAGRSGSNSSRKPKAARKSDRLALIGAEKWQGIIRRNGQSAAILSTQSLTCGSRQVTFISLNGYYYAVLACSVDFALSRVGCKCWRISELAPSIYDCVLNLSVDWCTTLETSERLLVRWDHYTSIWNIQFWEYHMEKNAYISNANYNLKKI